MAGLESLMRRTPLFRERPRNLQILTGLVVPAVFGAITGVILGLTAAGYWAISLVALVGGVLAGFEHAHGWEGADRGVVGGALFGTGILVAHAIAGTEAQVSLGSFPPLLVVFTAVIGMLAGALGGRLRRITAEHSAAPKSAAKAGGRPA
jgi:hypothetical protein